VNAPAVAATDRRSASVPPRFCRPIRLEHRGAADAALAKIREALFASASPYACTSVSIGTRAATAMNSRPSWRVMFATDRTMRSCHSRRYGNDGMSLM
jgi:hypothetical protein